MGRCGLVVPWTWALARCQGTSHIRDSTPCQDALRCITVGPDKGILAAVVSDGAGSASYGGHGSAIIARSITESARVHFESTNALPSDEEAWAWIDSARDRIIRIAPSRSSELRQFAATLVAVFATEIETLVMHVGDGAAVLRIDGIWGVPSWPANGEYASTTYFVTDEPAPQLRLTRVAARPDAIAVFSDGLERLALEFGERRAFARFFEGIFKPVWSSKALGFDVKLSATLKGYLNSPAINNRTDDDKSLILASRL
jgi:hypothetical protein